MNTIQAVVMAIMQGATELFPVSSLGHAVVLPAWLHWRLDENAPEFLPFLVMLHLGTATALFLFFWRDWWALARGILGIAEPARIGQDRRTFLLIVVATIPAVIVGFALERFFRSLFGSPIAASAFLVVNGLLLIFGERIRARGHRAFASLTMLDALIIGCWQCAALIPGISRSGATIVGGLTRGVDHEGSAHFSFLIATPIILGATVLEVPKLMHATVAPGLFGLSLLAAVLSGITAWLSAWFLMRYFRDHDEWALNPFAYYCLAAGLVSLIYLSLA
jgi:undecaprenyl-diphosphatase